MARILVVDDDVSIRELLKEFLTSLGHEVETGADCREAVQLVRKRPYALAILDRNTPFMTGVEAIELIRADPKNQKLKIMMFTSASMVREVEEAFRAGADDYLLKPINLKLLNDKVQTLLAKQA